MRNILTWVMSSRVNASLTVACLSAMPLFGWIANGLLALVVLRMGPLEGIWTYFAGLIPLLLLSIFSGQAYDVKIIIFTLTLFVAWYLGSAHRLFPVFFGLSISSLLLYFGLAAQDWSHISQVKSEMVNILIKTQDQEYSLLNGQGLKVTPETASNLADQLLVNLVMINVLFGLFMGRWWQALLYNPGGFQKEFHNLEAPKLWVGVLALAPVVLDIFFKISAASWIIALQVPLLLLGISFVHFWVQKKHLVSAWLVLFYVTLPWTSLLVILLGVADTFFGIKQKLSVQGNQP